MHVSRSPHVAATRPQRQAPPFAAGSVRSPFEPVPLVLLPEIEGVAHQLLLLPPSGDSDRRGSEHPGVHGCAVARDRLVHDDGSESSRDRGHDEDPEVAGQAVQTVEQR